MIPLEPQRQAQGSHNNSPRNLQRSFVNKQNSPHYITQPLALNCVLPDLFLDARVLAATDAACPSVVFFFLRKPVLARGGLAQADAMS